MREARVGMCSQACVGAGDGRLMHGFRCGFTCVVSSLGKVLMWFTETPPKEKYGH